MSKAYVFLATGFEEIEALTPVDILRRGGHEVTVVSVTGENVVTGARGINVKADVLFESLDKDAAELLILPGGMPGTTNLSKYEPLMDLVIKYNEEGKRISAICAAPTVFGGLGILKGKKATCYPGLEDKLTGADVYIEPVITDGNITTSRGMGTAVDFSLELLRLLSGSDEAAAKMADAVVYSR